jgi:hypothetical protein
MTITNDAQNEEWFEKDLNKFYKWLEEKYPKIYEKYHSNFSYPFQINGGFTINSNNKISNEELDNITAIANEFYKTLEA